MKSLSEAIEKFSDINFTEEYLDVIKELSENSKVCINVIGSAGTGKSTLLNILHWMCSDENVVVCSSTGVASALLNASHPNIKATTIHSTFGLNAQTIFSSTPSFINKKVRDVIENVDYLFIDEVSMVNCSLLDQVFRIMFEVRRSVLKELPKIVLFGDVLQLPPVINKDVTIKKFFDDEYNGKYFYFNSKCFKKMNPKIIQLNKVFRQDAKGKFAEVLNRIRVNKATEDDLKFINTRVKDECEFMADHESAIRLVTTNREVNLFNKLGSDMLPTDFVRVFAEIRGDFKKSADYKEDLYPDVLEIKVGSPIMITRNDVGNDRQFVNGDIGILEDLNQERAIVRLNNDFVVTVPRMETVAYEYIVKDIQGSKTKGKKVEAVEIGKYINIPIKTAFSSTIHKCQGRTLDYGIIDLSNWVSESAVYVALSRFRNIDSFVLIKPLTMKDIKVNTEAIEWLKFQESDEKIEELKNEEKEKILELIKSWEEKYNCKW